MYVVNHASVFLLLFLALYIKANIQSGCSFQQYCPFFVSRFDTLLWNVYYEYKMSELAFANAAML